MIVASANSLHNGVEHRLGVVERVADHSENVGSGSLLLERFAEFARPRLHLVEQPHVLDRDYRLVCEGGDKLDLFVGERLDLRLPQRNRAQRGALAQHGHHKRGPILTELLRLPQRSFRRVIFGIGQHVGDVHCATFNDGPACGCSPVRQDRVFRPQFFETGDVVESGGRASARPVEAENQPVGRAAQPRRRLDQRVEHGLQIEGRAADHLEHVCGGGLSLQRLPQFVEKPRVLDGNDRLGGEVP
jgi:hypothetical protein